MPGSSTNETIIQPNPLAGGQPAPSISLPGQGSWPSSGGSSNNTQGSGQNTITIDDEVSLSGPSTGLNGTPQQSGPSSGGSVQPATPGTDFNNAVNGMAPGANGSGQNQSSGNATGWWKNGNDWYYFDPVTGNMVKGWKYDNGCWYYLDPKTGIMATGWIKEDGLWYYLEPNNGHMLTGWQYINQEWYYLETTNGNGQMVTGWKFHNGKWYYLFESGAMAHGGWLKVDEKWYCVRDNGELEVSKILEYNGKKYYVNDKGAMITRQDQETVTYNGVTYEVAGDGVCTAIGNTRPADANMQSWKAYIESTPELSQIRKVILLAGIACMERGCVYHQLRSGYKTPHSCMSSCDGEIHPQQGNKEYDYSTMAAYNINEPKYLDCSFFVKHCYWKAGIEMDCSTTEGMSKKADFVPTTKEELKPADIAVKGEYVTVKVNGKDKLEWKNGHVIVFVGYTSTNEMVWVEMGSHGNDRKFTSKSLGAEYRLKKFKHNF
ncbi:hypothetical protein LBYZC6_21910 [Lacrimispora brassicae]